MVKMASTMLEKAKTEFAKAKWSSPRDGVQFPIHLDLPADQSSKINAAQAHLKQTIEQLLVAIMWLSMLTNYHLDDIQMQPS